MRVIFVIFLSIILLQSCNPTSIAIDNQTEAIKQHNALVARQTEAIEALNENCYSIAKDVRYLRDQSESSNDSDSEDNE